MAYPKQAYSDLGPEFNQEIASELIEIHRSRNSTEIELRIQVCK